MCAARFDTSPAGTGPAGLRLERRPLDVRASVADALRAVRDERRPFALCGRWAGGGALVGSEPLKLAPAGVQALESLAVPAVPGPEGAVGGGWFGYLGYGLGAEIEEVGPPPPRPDPLPAASLAFYDHLLRLDGDGQWWFEALVDERRSDALAARRYELERRLREAPPRRGWRTEGMTLRGPGAGGHLRAVAECVERIRSGEIFQANLALRLEGTLRGSGADAFAEAMGRLEPPYGAYLGLDRGAILSFSPELFLRRRGRTVVTAPIKGTLARREGGEPDAGRATLAGSRKDAAENVMIVDLMRNDLGRVCRPGSIRASDRPAVEAHPGVWHLVSRVEGTLRDDVDDGELVRAAFPPGSVTGAPKIQATKVISALEPTGREAYTGAIGYASPVAGLELSVAIRTFEILRERLWLGAGGGVVADSDPAAELAEALAKARPLAAALGCGIKVARGETTRGGPLPPLARPLAGRRPDPAGGLLETVLVEAGRPLALDGHLARLDASARRLYGHAPPPDLELRARAAAARLAGVRGRLRIVAVAQGHGAWKVAIEAAPVSVSADTPEPVVLVPHLVPGGLGEHKWADRAPVAALEADGTAPVLVDWDGAVLEAGSANVWAVEGRRLLTPPADGRMLPGLTRARVLAAASRWGFEAREETLDLDRLRTADGILLTSSVRLVAAARLAGGEPAPSGAGAEAVAAELRGRLGGHGGHDEASRPRAA